MLQLFRFREHFLIREHCQQSIMYMLVYVLDILARSDLRTTNCLRTTVHYLLVSAHPRVRIREHRQQLCDVHGELGSWQPRLGWGEGWVFM